MHLADPHVLSFSDHPVLPAALNARSSLTASALLTFPQSSFSRKSLKRTLVSRSRFVKLLRRVTPSLMRLSSA